MTTNINPYEAKTVEEVLTEFNVHETEGLSLKEIQMRQSSYGLNQVPEAHVSTLLLFGRHFWGLTAFMLEFTIAVSFLLHKYIDVCLISGLMVFNAIVGFLQERKAAKTVKALKNSLQVIVRVLRAGKWGKVSAKQLVPGDIIRIRTGDFITADAKLINGTASLDQSALTGESAWVDKQQGDIVYAGSSIKSGECNAVVVGTGIRTFFGKTAELVQEAKPRMHMDEVVRNIVKILSSIVIAFLVITLTISIIRGEAFLSTLPLILILFISAIPVALPAMFSVTMANGSRQLAAKGVLVSRLSATEDAATMTALCIDKTGTLTQNILTIQELIPAGNFTSTEVLQYAVMASVAANNDPIDLAFIQKSEDEKSNLSSFKVLTFTPFTAALKRTEALIQKDEVTIRVLKGAYTTIKELCHTPQAGFDQKVTEWGSKGFKTIAVALVKDDVTQWVGIAALMDPPIPDSGAMVARLKELGVIVKMLTGDASPVAKEVALKVGIGEKILAASLFRDEPDSDKKIQLVMSSDGFSEVLPEDKFNIVKVLQEHHEITGMTGDGVNDAPALRQAEVGIAVKKATDVAKQAASVILLHEGLESIISLITIGRDIHQRITNWVVSKISKTLFTVVFVCVAYLVSGQFIVNAYDMVLLLIIVDFVTLTLSTDSVIGSKKPNNWEVKPLLELGFLLGFLNCAEAFLWFFIGKKYFQISEVNEIHSFSFAILFFTSIINIPVIRTRGRFFSQPIGKTLFFTILGDILIAIVFLTSGMPGFTALPPLLTITTLTFFLLSGLLINDWIKTKFLLP